MLKAIFYARFHPERGPSVIHQYPNNSIKASDGEAALVSWSEISSYIIAPYDLCNQPLSICNNGYRILGYPISLEHEEYDRNRFTFNVCLVLAEQDDAKPFEQILRKIVRFCIELEWNGCILQTEEDLPGLKLAGEVGYPGQTGRVYMLLERILEDLNAYGEACIRVDDVHGQDGVHVLNLRLELEKEFGKKTPDRVRSWDVPLLVRSIPSQSEWTWDLTLQRIHEYIDGIRHVRKIAELADVELKLVRGAIKELIYHGRAVLLDIFHFQAIYTCTEEVTFFFQDVDLQDECRRYVAIPPEANSPQHEERKAEPRDDDKNDVPSREHILQLYTDLHPGLQLQEFCLTHKAELTNIDIRRLITFGILKGILRRVHRYALALERRPISPVSTRSGVRSGTNKSARSGGLARSEDEAVRDFERAWRKSALTSGWATPPSGPHPSSLSRSHRSADQVRTEEDERLREYLDGNHCMDQICVEMKMSEKKVLERLRSGKLGEVILFNK
ncbi:putative nitrogen permease regulator 2 [Septoria linicola]|nr:putative nitrogen permease regulator 2 [Septoria linicola]